MSEELSQLSAVRQVELYRRGELSPVEVTEAALKRIDKLNPRLNAFVFIGVMGRLEIPTRDRGSRLAAL